VFDVTVDWVNILGFTVTGATGSFREGIHLDSVNCCNISNNNASNNNNGIGLWYSSNNILANNIANSNGMYGILLYYSSDNTLTNNTANLNSFGGILLQSSSNNALTNNIANSNNERGIYLIDSSNNILMNNILVNDGLFVVTSYRNTVKNNTINGKPLAYLEDTSNYTIQDAGQVVLVNCTNVTVENLNLSNASIGMELWGTNDCKIVNNRVSNNRYGIYMVNSSNNTLQNNTADSNYYYGIYMWDSSNNNTLTNNIFANCGFFVTYSYKNTVKNNTVNGKPLAYFEDTSNFTIQNAGQVILVNCTNVTAENLNLSNASVGMELWGTNDCKVVNNNASSNSWYGIYLTGSRNNTLTNNTANSNKLYGIYMEDSSNNELINNNAASNNRVGIRLRYSSNNTLQSNTANSNDWYGIHIYSSNNNILTDNIANLNDDGIYLWHSSSTTLTNNTASDNYCGVNLYYSSNNTLTDNTASDNYLGIRLYYLSNNNTLYHNNLINNTNYNAYDSCTNQWDSGSEGNYWSDYTGNDNNTDGIGDSPYPIPPYSTSVDRYPLMCLWTATQQKGDLNSDGTLTPADAAIALAIAASGAHDDAADVSGDGHVTSLDALTILQAAAGRIEL